MKKVSLSLCILSGLLLFGGIVRAAASDITFPIPELDGCKDKAECRAYCDDLAHKEACIAFAKKHNLIDEEAEARAKKIPPIGPGNCTGEKSCSAYCDAVEHFDECLSFSKIHGLIDDDRAGALRKSASEKGPGECRGISDCRNFCDDPAHKNECLEFARKKGLISDEKVKVAKEVLKNGGPGGCKDETECKAYCADTAHVEECFKFGQEHGLVSKDDALRIKKAGLVPGPGGCKGEECKTFCQDPARQEECLSFAEKSGLMTKEELLRARKIVGKPGPGGCGGEECKTYCADSLHSAECTEFGLKNGFISKEEAARAKKFEKITKEGGPGGCKGEECKIYCSDQAHRDECYQFAKQKGFITPEDEKNFETGKKIAKKIKENGGPGGCARQDECRAYCADADHVEECGAFGVAHGNIPEAGVRQKLKEFEEKRRSASGEFRSLEDIQRSQGETAKRFEEFKALEEEFRRDAVPRGTLPEQIQKIQLRPEDRDSWGGTEEIGECVSSLLGNAEESSKDPKAFAEKKSQAHKICLDRANSKVPKNQERQAPESQGPINNFLDSPGSNVKQKESSDPGVRSFPARPPEDSSAGVKPISFQGQPGVAPQPFGKPEESRLPPPLPPATQAPEQGFFANISEFLQK